MSFFLLVFWLYHYDPQTLLLALKVIFHRMGLYSHISTVQLENLFYHHYHPYCPGKTKWECIQCISIWIPCPPHTGSTQIHPHTVSAPAPCVEWTWRLLFHMPNKGFLQWTECNEHQNPVWPCAFQYFKMTEGHSQVEIPTLILQFNSTFAVWQWTLLFLCDNTLFDRFLVQKWPCRCELISLCITIVLGSIILGNLEQCFFLILASRTACTVHTKRAVQQYIEPRAHNKNQYLRQCTVTYAVVRIILVKLITHTTMTSIWTQW